MLAGRYVLVTPMASGGAGVVWRSYDRLLERTVAVKLLRADVATDASTTSGFRTEAATAAQLNHPHVVVIHDIGRDGDEHYLVMEFVEGGTLADVLRSGPLAPGVTAGVGAQVARALGAAHRRRLVHRDVKPANVLLTADGMAKVADFGIAASMGAASSGSTLPRQVLGTARYLAPEQLRDQQVDARADVYALGVVLHEALTGQVPFGEGTPTEVASRRLIASLPPVSARRSDVPFALDRAIVRATRLDPDERFADGGAFADELARSASADASRELAVRVARRRRVRGGQVHPDDGVAPSGDVPIPGGEDTTTASLGVPRDSGPLVADRSPAATALACSALPVEDATSVHRSETAPRRQRVTAWLVVAALLTAGGAALTLEPSGRGLAAIGLERTQDRASSFPVGGLPADPEVRTSQEQPGGSTAFDRLVVVDSRDHDPFGSGEEHRGDVGNITDGDPSTTWQTHRYRGSAAFGGLKSGVGVWLDVGYVEEVTEVAVHLTQAGASFAVYVGDAPPAPGASPEEWGRLVTEVVDAESRVRRAFAAPEAGRVWLVWFRRLPPDGEQFRASVSEVALLRS